MHFEAVIVLRSNLLIVLELYIVTSCIVYLANTINTASISQTYVASHVRRIHSGAGFANAHLFLVCSFRVMATQNVKVWLFIVYYTKHFDQHSLHQQSHTINLCCMQDLKEQFIQYFHHKQPLSNLGNPQCQSVRENGFNKGGFILESAPEKLGVQITPEVDSRLDPSVMFDFSIWWESGSTLALIGLSDFGVFWSWTLVYIHLCQ